jgi:predicted RNase H-like HicB family nuclease
MGALTFRVLLKKEPEGGYTVIIPSLPGFVSYGDTTEEAVEVAKYAIELYLEGQREYDDGDEISIKEEDALEYTMLVETVPLQSYSAHRTVARHIIPKFPEVGSSRHHLK